MVEFLLIGLQGILVLAIYFGVVVIVARTCNGSTGP